MTLIEAGIDHKLSSRAQQYAAIPKQELESILAAGREAGRRKVAKNPSAIFSRIARSAAPCHSSRHEETTSFP